MPCNFVLTSRSLKVSLLLTLALLTASSPYKAIAQDESESETSVSSSEPSRPLIVVAFPDGKRLQAIMEQLARMSGREDALKVPLEQMKKEMERAHSDPSRPNGQLAFMLPGFPPKLVGVQCSPVEDKEKYLEYFRTRFRFGENSTFAESTSEPGLYEITRPDGNAYRGVRIEDGYAFQCFQRDFRYLNLEGVSAKLDAVFSDNDISLRVYPDAVPKGLRQVLMTFLRNAASAALQQVDGERDGVYQARRATGDYALDLLEQIVNETDGVSFNLKLEEDGRVHMQGRIEALADSKFAEFLKHFGGKRSLFANMAADPTADTIHVSFTMDEDMQQWLTALVQAGSLETAYGLDVDDIRAHPMHRLFETLKTTFENGHVDFIIQAVGMPREGLVFLFGMRTHKGQAAAQGLREMLQKIAGQTGLVDISLDADSHAGVTFHRIGFTVIDNDVSWFFGGAPALWMGASNNAIWMALGAGEPMLELAHAIDTIQEATPPSDDNGVSAIRITGHAGRWFAAAEDPPPVDPENPRALSRDIGRRALAAARDVFLADDDTLELRLQSSEEGLTGTVDLAPTFAKSWITSMVTSMELAQARARDRAEEAKRRAEEERRKAEQAQQEQ